MTKNEDDIDITLTPFEVKALASVMTAFFNMMAKEKITPSQELASMIMNILLKFKEGTAQNDLRKKTKSSIVLP